VLAPGLQARHHPAPLLLLGSADLATAVSSLLHVLLLVPAVPHAYYEFAEFPWPADLTQDAAAGGGPSSQAVQAYVQAYAEHFGLLQHIRWAAAAAG
jgi:hypothetical protein